MDIIMQSSLFGPPQPADIVEGVKSILRAYPEARNDYKTLTALYWLQFDGLVELLATRPTREQFVDWMREVATSPKTLQNRAMEVQREHPELDSTPTVRAYRDAQATAGVVR